MTRPVTLLSTGGTISMTGEQAVPTLGAGDLVAGVAGVVEARSVLTKPGAQLTVADALLIAREAVAAASAGTGVVVTQGTDTLEETAMLAAMMHGEAAPIVFTGSIRPSSHAGADGAANLRDAVAVAASGAARDAGVLVVFGGEIHAARMARKSSSISPTAFRSPRGGPIGAVIDGVVSLWARQTAIAPLAVPSADARVPIVSTWLGDDGALLRSAAADASAIVLVALGAGHIPPPVLAALREVASSIPVAVTVRPEDGAILRSTYGFEGSEADVRESGAIPCAALSPPAARMALIAALGAGADPAAVLSQFDT